MKGLVTKKIADKFFVDGNVCVPRGGLKKQGIFVGDQVEYNEKDFVIEKVYNRKNLLLRPPIANIDKLFITIAPIPKPDFLLVDKLILLSELNSIKHVLCVNKSDILSETQKEEILKIYSGITKIVFVSAKTNHCASLRKMLCGVCAFAGQSAVGKSSIMNAIFGEEREKVGGLAKKVARGKQTTRVVSLNKIKSNCYIADTAGFSKFDESLLNLSEKELAQYYPDFRPFVSKCKFASCAHINDFGCQVREGVKNGKIGKERYENYKKIYQNLKERRKYEKKS